MRKPRSSPRPSHQAERRSRKPRSSPRRSHLAGVGEYSSIGVQSGRHAEMTASGVIHQSGRRVWRGCNRPPTEVLADGCIGHPGPDFSDEHRRGSGGARRARLVLSAQGAVEERRLRGPQREPPPGARRSTRRPVAVASIVSERATQLLGCGAALCGRGVGRVRRPGHGLIVAGGVAASRLSRTRPLVSCCVPSLRALPLEEACELRIRPGRWRSLAPGKESVAKRSRSSRPGVRAVRSVPAAWMSGGW